MSALRLNMASKRFALMCLYTVIYAYLLLCRADLAIIVTPYAYGLAGAYIIGESWRPAGTGGTA